MSVTVADLLRLPSLRNAEVIAGRGGLNKIVSSISVLESIDPVMLNDSMFINDEFYGSEIVITGFLNATEDYELQCRNIKRLAEGGEVGLILYYVGMFMKSIDESLIKLADELDFALICMPRGRVDLRYSEVICDVMGAIIKDQLEDASLTVSLLERVARLPQHQQTVDTMMKMLSDRLRATVILTDENLRVLNEAAWPRELSGLHAYLKDTALPKPMGPPAEFPAIPNGLIYRETVRSGVGSAMELFIIRDSERLAGRELQQAGECIRLAVSLWSHSHEHMVISELVRAILTDEPLKMRSLAELFKVDIASVDSMWVFSGCEFSAEHTAAVTECAARFCATAFADVFDDCLTLFTNGPESALDVGAIIDSAAELVPENATLSLFTNLDTTADVRGAFLQNQEYLADAKKIMPHRPYYSGSDIGFAKNCRDKSEEGEADVAEILSPLRALKRKRDSDELEETLCAYLLDAGQSVTATAERLFVHKNTVKYRLKCMSDCFGFTVGQMPASYRLYETCAVRRLMAVD